LDVLMANESQSPILLWFRQDLRIQDNPALAAALETGHPVIPTYIWSPEDEGQWVPGEAQQWWLHEALSRFSKDLEDLGSRLILRTGPAEEVLESLASETGAVGLYWNRRYEPTVTERDARIKKRFKDRGMEAKSFNSSLLFEPWTVATGAGKPYQVYTPFWKNVTRGRVKSPVGVEDGLLVERSPRTWPESIALESLSLLPDLNWHESIAEAWIPGEAAARERLDRFLGEAAEEYGDKRDFPAVEGTSGLSPYLHFGHIGPRQVWEAIHEHELHESPGGQVYLKELVWREFAYHVMFHFPHTPDSPLRGEYKQFPWERDEATLKAWQRGKTGYPLVDAGMRQLWKEGWMHNRVRMVVASLLVKHLLHDWRDGAEWFWDTLVDADLASNSLGWQWAGGCGADAAPYFRVFNPITQGEKFDPEGEYIRKYVPELSKLEVPYIHQPWEAPASVLEAAGIELGRNYPEPIIEHKEGRQRALDALEQFKSQN
jgi:deoxyribodipyrimidine photo-lyase